LIVSRQYLRAIAAALVVAHHAVAAMGQFYELPAFAAKGGFGVDLFFVISGFIMWHNTVESGMTPAAFMRRRIARIVPLYWLITLAMFALLLVSNSASGGHPRTLADLAASLLFVPIGDWNSYMPVYGPGWTINYEMFFYALFGLCLFIRDRTPRAAALLVALVTLVVAGIVWPTSSPFGWYTAPILLEFAAGVLIGIAYHRSASISAWTASAMLVSGAICILFVSANEPHIPGWHGTRALNWGVPAALIVCGAVFLERGGLVRRFEPLVFLGDASYSLYLTHVFSIFAVSMVWQRLDLWMLPGAGALFFLAASSVSLLAGNITHIWIEKPLWRLARGQAAFPRKPIAIMNGRRAPAE
jgi:exopolysaccharide production protein ExoZ